MVVLGDCMVVLGDCMVEGCTVTACIGEVMVGLMDLLACMVVECIIVVWEALWVVMEWVWVVVLMEFKIQIIHMVILHLLQGFGGGLLAAKRKNMIQFPIVLKPSQVVI
jgi:hypothetical protein